MKGFVKDGINKIKKFIFISLKQNFRFFLRDRINLIPKRISLVLETLNLRRQCFTHCLALLVPTFSFLISPSYIDIRLLKHTKRSATIFY